MKRFRSSKTYNPTFKIDLIKVFNRSYRGESRELRDKLRASLSSSQFRSQFSKSVIDRIIERTNKGIDRHNAKFPKYSESYVNSDTFKIYGKSPSDINLELSGEMLSSLKGVSSLFSISIGLVGQLNKAKAHGHVNGIKSKRYGKVKRDFLGVPDEDLDAVMIEAVEQFRNESFEEASNLFAGQELSVSGNVGDQSGFGVGVSVQDILAELMRNLNG